MVDNPFRIVEKLQFSPLARLYRLNFSRNIGLGLEWQLATILGYIHIFWHIDCPTRIPSDPTPCIGQIYAYIKSVFAGSIEMVFYWRIQIDDIIGVSFNHSPNHFGRTLMLRQECLDRSNHAIALYRRRQMSTLHLVDRHFFLTSVRETKLKGTDFFFFGSIAPKKKILFSSGMSACKSPASLLRLSHDVRKILYHKYLGRCSMSIAILRQTCSTIRSEIQDDIKKCHYQIPELWGPQRQIPFFPTRINSSRLDNCSIPLIESMLGTLQRNNVDAKDWDGLFCNAVSRASLGDVDRLLHIFHHPSSLVLSYCQRMPVTFKNPVLSDLALLVSKCDSKTILSYILRLPCDCVRIYLFCVAIRQGLSSIFDCYIQNEYSYETIKRAGLLLAIIGLAVGKSGNIGYFEQILPLLKPHLSTAFVATCGAAAAGRGQLAFVQHVMSGKYEIHETFLQSAISRAFNKGDKQMIEYLLPKVDLQDAMPTLLAEAARKGYSDAFQQAITICAEKSFADWRADFLRAVRVDQSLFAAFKRGDQHFLYFLDLYSRLVPNELNPKFDTFQFPVTGIPGRLQNQIWKRMALDAIDGGVIPARFVFMIKSILQFFNVDPLAVCLDCLHALVVNAKFLPKLLDAVFETFFSHNMIKKLAVKDRIDIAKLAFTDEAFEWVILHFNVTITAEIATTMLGSNIDFEGYQNYFKRCLALGAKFEPLQNYFADIVAISLDIPFEIPKLLPRRGEFRVLAYNPLLIKVDSDPEILRGVIERLFTSAVTLAPMPIVKKLFERIGNQPEFLYFLLGDAERDGYFSKEDSAGIHRMPVTGCFDMTKTLAKSLFLAGRVRTHQYLKDMASFNNEEAPSSSDLS